MKQLLINVEYEVFDKIIRDQLAEELEHMKSNLEFRKNDGAIIPIFEVDKEEDLRLIEKHIEAFELTLKWFS